MRRRTKRKEGNVKKIILLIVLGVLFCLSGCSSAVELSVEDLYELQEKVTAKAVELSESSHYEELDESDDEYRIKFLQKAMDELKITPKAEQKVRVKGKFYISPDGKEGMLYIENDDKNRYIYLELSDSKLEECNEEVITIEGIFFSKDRDFSKTVLSDCKLIK